MHTPARELLQRTDVEEGSVEVRFGPVPSFPAMRALAQRFGRLFGHIVRLNIRYLYPDQLRELLGEFLIAFLSSLRREPEVSEPGFMAQIWIYTPPVNLSELT
jgi:hypothetical protein